MTSRLARAAIARDAAYARLRAAMTADDLAAAKRDLLAADARWRGELARIAAGKRLVTA